MFLGVGVAERLVGVDADSPFSVDDDEVGVAFDFDFPSIELSMISEIYRMIRLKKLKNEKEF
jgi:hypothetical protein